MTVLFEDGFETGDLSKWSAQNKSAGETITVVSIAPVKGQYHADFETDGIEAGEMAYLTLNTPSYMECFIRQYTEFLKALPGVGKIYVPLNIRTAGASGYAMCYVEIFNLGGIPVWRLYWVDAIGEHFTDTGVPVELNKSYCIEVHVKVGATDGRYEFWLNGQKLLDISGIDNQTTRGPVNMVIIGERWSSAQVAHGVYIDEFVIADQYIGPLPGIFSVVVTSNPVTGVPITVDGSPYNTPTSPLNLQPGPHTVIAPSNVSVNAIIYNFVSWEDGSTNPVRSINLIGNVTLTCTYQLASTTKTAIEIHAFGVGIREMNLQYEIVGIKQGTTPDTVEVPAGTYTVKVTYQGTELTREVQATEGQTMRVDFQFGPPVIFPQFFPWLRDMLSQFLTRLRTIRDFRR